MFSFSSASDCPSLCIWQICYIYCVRACVRVCVSACGLVNCHYFPSLLSVVINLYEYQLLFLLLLLRSLNRLVLLLVMQKVLKSRLHPLVSLKNAINGPWMAIRLSCWSQLHKCECIHSYIRTSTYICITKFISAFACRFPSVQKQTRPYRHMVMYCSI